MKKVQYLLLSILLISCAGQALKQSALKGKTHNGKIINHEYAQTKGTVLVFLSSVCPCSNSNSKVVIDLVKKYPEFTFFGVHSNADETLEMGRKYFSDKGFNFPIIYDEDSSIAKKFGALKTPHVFIVGPSGEVIYNGSVTSSTNADLAKEIYLDTALSEIIMGQIPSEPKKKTLGCYIKLKG